MEQGGDSFERARREWLKRALLAGAAMPLLPARRLAASARPNGLLGGQGRDPGQRRPAKLGTALKPGDSVATAAGVQPCS